MLMRSSKERERKRVLQRIAEAEAAQKKAEDNNVHRDPTPEEKALKELVFPEEWAFPIHPNFRLWMGTIPVAGFPASFARKCLKVSLELPTSIRPNSLKTLGSIPHGDFASITNH